MYCVVEQRLYWHTRRNRVCSSSPEKVRIVQVAVDRYNHTHTLKTVFIAAGSLPLLLSLPIYVAKFCVNDENDAYWKRVVSMPCFVDSKYGIAFAANVVFILYGLLVLISKSEKNAVQIELCGIFAEICLIGFVTVVCQVPAVSEDETKTFLTKVELHQLEHTGTLNAPYICVTNVALNLKYDRELRYLYPFEFSQRSAFSITDTHVAAMSRHHFQRNSIDVSDESESKSFNKNELIRSNHQRHKSVFGEGVSIQAHKELVSTILNGNPSGFDNCFFVSALGHADLESLGPELKSQLFACLGGGTSRLIQRAAIISLGNLFFKTKNPRVSHRLLSVWGSCEISTIRKACSLAMEAIGFERVTDFNRIMNKIQDIKAEDLKKLSLYFESLQVDSSLLRSKTCPSVKDIIDVLKDSSCSETSVEILVYLCVQDSCTFSYVYLCSSTNQWTFEHTYIQVRRYTHTCECNFKTHTL